MLFVCTIESKGSQFPLVLPAVVREHGNPMSSSDARTLGDQGCSASMKEPVPMSFKPNEAVKLFRDGCSSGLKGVEYSIYSVRKQMCGNQ